MITGSLHAGARPKLRVAFAGLLIAWLTGCGEPHRNPFTTTTPRPSIAVEVHNNNYLDVVVYALRDGGRVRLGTVTGKCDTTLKMSVAAGPPQGFRLQADPVGSLESYVTDVIYADLGTIVVLDVGSSLGMSSWHLR